MSGFFIIVTAFVLATVAVGLARILRGPADADRMMAAQLLGTGGVATLLLSGTVTGDSAVVNVALTLALLAAFASVAFYMSATGGGFAEGEDDEGDRK